MLVLSSFLLILLPVRILALAPQAEPKAAIAQPSAARTPREIQIASDTERLYRLCKELQAELQKETPNTLSTLTLKRAEEIEQLAHRLNDEMKRK